MFSNLSMGIYGIYVWSCFAMTLVVFLIVELQARQRHRRIYREIDTRIRAMADSE